MALLLNNGQKTRICTVRRARVAVTGVGYPDFTKASPDKGVRQM
jgi:hypothetical protein